MRLCELRIRNLRAIKDSGSVAFCGLQALIGENNAGKSTVLIAVESLMSSGAGGISQSDFNDADAEMIVSGTFAHLTPHEEALWRLYLVAGTLILEKRLRIETDERTSKTTVKAEFHGYRAEPQDWFLSVTKIEARSPGKVKWADVIAGGNLPDYFAPEGKASKANFEKALNRYLADNTVAYDPPDLSCTQALGIQSRVVASLPAVYFLRAISDYSNEIDRRSSTTTFRRLMADLSDRILQADPRYQEIHKAFQHVRALFNGDVATGTARLVAVDAVEARITSLLRELMPTVAKVRLHVETDEARDVFSRGVALRVDDGAETDVLAKGHGLQRCIIFSLLRALILNHRDALVQDTLAQATQRVAESRSIMFLIEEPELYIHPQLCKLFYDTLFEFSATDQVVYTTHSPLFVDATQYESIAVVSRVDKSIGSKTRNCHIAAFDGLSDRKLFRGLTRLNPAVNELFFARHVLLVEGPEDSIAVAATLQALDMIKRRVEEIDVTVVVAGGKPTIPFFQRVLNAFRIPYAVLHDGDVSADQKQDAMNIEAQRNGVSWRSREHAV